MILNRWLLGSAVVSLLVHKVLQAADEIMNLGNLDEGLVDAFLQEEGILGCTG